MEELAKATEEYIEMSRAQDTDIKRVAEQAKSVLKRSNKGTMESSNLQVYGLTAIGSHSSQDQVRVINEKIHIRSFPTEIQPTKILE